MTKKMSKNANNGKKIAIDKTINSLTFMIKYAIIRGLHWLGKSPVRLKRNLPNQCKPHFFF